MFGCEVLVQFTAREAVMSVQLLTGYAFQHTTDPSLMQLYVQVTLKFVELIGLQLVVYLA